MPYSICQFIKFSSHFSSATDAKNHTTGFDSLNLALLNIRSLAGESFLIHDFIIKHSLNFMFLTESRLNQDNSAAVHIESSPPYFCFISETRMHK